MSEELPAPVISSFLLDPLSGGFSADVAATSFVFDFTNKDFIDYIQNMCSGSGKMTNL